MVMGTDEVITHWNQKNCTSVSRHCVGGGSGHHLTPGTRQNTYL